MAVLDKYIEKTKIEEENLHHLISSIFSFTDIKDNYKHISTVDKKEEIVDGIISLLEKYLELGIVKNKSQKLEIIDVLDKLHFRKEVLEGMKNNIDFEKIEKAGKKLGKKSQSAFLKKSSTYSN